jgi:hypothetical protein
MASSGGRSTTGHYYFYYGSNSNNACSSSGSNYTGDGISSYGGGLYSRAPSSSIATTRSRLGSGGTYSSSRSTGSSWTSPTSRSSKYLPYRNVSPASLGSKPKAEENVLTACSSPPGIESPVELTAGKSSVFLTRSDSASSSGSARSTGTMCDEREVLASSSSPRERQLRSTEPPSRVLTPLEAVQAAENTLRLSNSSKKTGKDLEDVVKDRKTADSVRERDQKKEVCSEMPEISREVKRPPVRRQSSNGPSAATVAPPPSNLQPNRLTADTEEDAQSVSTVSGSGIDFFRKFVQRKGSGCKECEDQFRREVLIDRLVADSLHSKAVLAAGSTARSARTNSNSGHY